MKLLKNGMFKHVEDDVIIGVCSKCAATYSVEPEEIQIDCGMYDQFSIKNQKCNYCDTESDSVEFNYMTHKELVNNGLLELLKD